MTIFQVLKKDHKKVAALMERTEKTTEKSKTRGKNFTPKQPEEMGRDMLAAKNNPALLAIKKAMTAVQEKLAA